MSEREVSEMVTITEALVADTSGLTTRGRKLIIFDIAKRGSPIFVTKIAAPLRGDLRPGAGPAP